MQELVFLKLGGSLITDKTQAYTVRHDKLTGLAAQIARSLHADPALNLVLGHGSGSFGHTAAKKYKTREGTPSHSGRGDESEEYYWKGFAEVWYQASRLNRYVLRALHEAGVPAMTFSPAASVWSESGQVETWDLSQIKVALKAGVVPVVHGDVVFDRAKGGTILSTEDLFDHLAQELHPGRILLAGLEQAVWADFPARKHRVEVLTRESFNEIRSGVGASVGVDVTGGMQSKVHKMLDLVDKVPGLQALIFSGEEDGNLEKALKGGQIGTRLEK